MTPAQSHILTRLMNCIPDLSTLNIEIRQGELWCEWVDAGLHMQALIEQDATYGWVTANGSHDGIPAGLAKCYECMTYVADCGVDACTENDPEHPRYNQMGGAVWQRADPEEQVSVMNWSIEPYDFTAA